MSKKSERGEVRMFQAEQEQIRKAAVLLGRLGGKAGTGKAKARPVTSEQMRAAVNARWAKAKGTKK